MRSICIMVMIICFSLVFYSKAHAQSDSSLDVQRLKSDVQYLKSRLDSVESKASRTEDYIPFVLIIFGAFSALWAQNTGRNPWLWFFLGYVFSIITVIVILVKNPRSRRQSL